MKLWLDDIRKPPDSTWTWVTTVDEAINFMSKWRVEEASLDNDLGTYQPEGRRLWVWPDDARRNRVHRPLHRHQHSERVGT